MKKYRFTVLLFILVLLFGNVKAQQTSEYSLGTGIADFTRLLNGKLPHNTGTYGYASYKNPVDTTKNNAANGIKDGVHLPLKARAMSITHVPSDEKFVYVLFDLAFVSDNIRRGIMQKLRVVDSQFQNSNLMLTATHTHSAPGGFTDYLGYEVATPGYRPDIVEAIVQRAYEAIIQSWKNSVGVDLIFSESTVPDSIPIAFNRGGLPAYNSNPEVKIPITPENNYEATDRVWQMIHFETDEGLHSILNFFGAHPNRMGSDVLSSDTRGAASEATEKILPSNGLAIFAQNAPGDIDDEGSYRGKVDKQNQLVNPPAYSYLNDEGKMIRKPREHRVLIEGEYLKRQTFSTMENPNERFEVVGGIDCELIYVDMGNQVVPKGNYAKTLDPFDYYKNDYFLFGIIGKFGSLFSPKLKQAQTSPPSIGLGAIARVSDRMKKMVINLERLLRYARLSVSIFNSKEKAHYKWQMYRSQGEKTVMLEGGEMSSAIGFRLGGTMFDIFSRFDMVLLELERDKQLGLHKEHTMYPQIVPLQIAIIGNVAIVGVSGEPGNIAGQRIERTIFEHLKHRDIKKVIVNGYANENTGYIFTPEEYDHQFTPNQCGFVLYGQWTSPAFRYNFEKLAKAMLVYGDEREALLDRTILPPKFSDEWYEKASFKERFRVK